MDMNEATRRQIEAADPLASTWLSANAGSGKTRVLTDRVARLLLQGVMPQHILCLTYTKAAASEMQNRLFKRLGSWAMKPDAELALELAELGVADVTAPDRLSNARTLFARAIETPGGLKIQTIHSFCAALLRRFPLEAGVSPQFVEMEDRAARLLREEIIEEMADGPDVAVIDGLARFYTGEDFSGLSEQVVKHREALSPAADAATIWSWFELPDQFDETMVLTSVFLGNEPDLIRSLSTAMAQSSTKKDPENAAKLSALDLSAPDLKTLEALESLMLTGAGAKSPFSAKIGSFPAKDTRLLLGDTLDAVNDLMARLEDTRPLRLGLMAARKTLALHQFADVFLPAYADRKMRAGRLDFDDLILRARNLLTDPAVAQWVLYRLDGGIDHILVDEAQDTSPQQWRVVEQLAQEFTSGLGARPDVERTIFVVGDKKQSIYSFQGADPEAFDRMHDIFGARLGAMGKSLNRLSLDFSFRSSLAILGTVDTTFEATGGTGLGGDTNHIAFHDGMPGRVDLWPVEPKTESEASREWHKPVDQPSEHHHNVRLAENIAAEIKIQCETGTIPTGNGEIRPITPGDFLILVQRRSDLFAEIIRACKKAELPIAGADRLKLAAELAVRDIAALLGFLATSDDDLSLAAALRSPLLGWDEAQLYNLAHSRHETQLWPALKRRQDEWPKTVAMLQDLRDSADFLRPYDLIERILTRHDGRRNIIARLGSEAEDGVDVLLAQALSYERSDVPSLTGFLSWLETDDVEVKRQLDSAGDQIRVMTVHGSKGLESPIVILPETMKRRARAGDELITLAEGQPVWKQAETQAPPAIKTALLQQKEANLEESRRLLYVAMTRAEKWLIVCAAGETGSGEDSWYSIIEQGLRARGAGAHSFDCGLGLRLSHGDWHAGALLAPRQPEINESPLPAWAQTSAPAPLTADKTLSPSDLGGAKALPGEGLSEEDAKRRGRQIHRLLEFLPAYPRDSWGDITRDLLAGGDDGATESEAAELLQDAVKVLCNQDLQFLFVPGTLAEVPFTATLGQSRLHGVIDRLVIDKDHILVVDFKTNAVVPETASDIPAGLLRQMAAYVTALSQIYPEHDIRAAILWTANAELMPINYRMMMDELDTTLYIDK
jgi:ATP-dependent helicase/nuclease subunit A